MSRTTPAPVAGDPLVQVRGLGVQAGRTRILYDVDLDLRAGEVTAVVGPNGAGKTTLLAALAGDVRPDSGTVRLAGSELHRMPVGELARQRAVLLQENRLSFPFTVLEVVRMGREPWRGRPEEDLDDAVVARSMHDTDVTHLAARAYPTLSGGEKARAALARVLSQEPRLLLLDEPTAALDLRHQEAVLDLARQRATGGDAVVAVLHDLTLAAAHADRIVVMAHGTVRAVGTAAEVLTPELLAEVYEHPVDVIAHPHGGGLIVLPRRAPRPTHPTAHPTAHPTTHATPRQEPA